MAKENKLKIKSSLPCSLVQSINLRFVPHPFESSRTWLPASVKASIAVANELVCFIHHILELGSDGSAKGRLPDSFWRDVASRVLRLDHSINVFFCFFKKLKL